MPRFNPPTVSFFPLHCGRSTPRICSILSHMVVALISCEERGPAVPGRARFDIAKMLAADTRLPFWAPDSWFNWLGMRSVFIKAGSPSGHFPPILHLPWPASSTTSVSSHASQN